MPGHQFEVAHGQLDEKELERRMLGFVRGDADVLVCDVDHRVRDRHPAGQHLIVERADLFGLAQLYQIRGRVGARANVRTRTCSIPAPRR